MHCTCFINKSGLAWRFFCLLTQFKKVASGCRPRTRYGAVSLNDTDALIDSIIMMQCCDVARQFEAVRPMQHCSTGAACKPLSRSVRQPHSHSRTTEPEEGTPQRKGGLKTIEMQRRTCGNNLSTTQGATSAQPGHRSTMTVLPSPQPHRKRQRRPVT